MENDKTRKKDGKFMNKKLSAEEIAEMADRGEDVTPFMTRPIQGYRAQMEAKNLHRTNIDFGLEMLCQLDNIAEKLNISRQAVVKMALQDYLTRYYKGISAYRKFQK